MAFITSENEKPKISSGRIALETKLTGKFKSKKSKDYMSWAIFDYILIRTYNDEYAVHIWNNADHNERFRRKYNTINYNATSFAHFLFLLLEPQDEYSVR